MNIKELDTFKHKAVQYENGFYGFIHKITGEVESGGMTLEQLKNHRQLRAALDRR